MPRHALKTLPICLALVLLTGVALQASPDRPAAARTYTVCAAGCDFATIRAALDDDRVVAGDIVQIADAVHTEAGIAVDKAVTIQGLGPDQTIVQAHDARDQAPDRVFLIPENVTVTLRGMTIRHGRPGRKVENGGGIMNYGTLTVENCVVADNIANGGGGIGNSSGATLTIVDSTIRDNVSDEKIPPFTSGLQCGAGGGIKCSAGTLTVVNSTISGNQAGNRSRGWGGGVHVACGCTATLTNSTISGNSALVTGGGFRVRGTLRLVNCTVSHNSIDGREGAGIVIGVGGTAELANTIVANNTGAEDFVAGGSTGYGYQGKGQVLTNDNNLIGDGSYPSAYRGDPRLGPLADNGGLTWTHALLPGSPAIDVVPVVSCTVTTDQRGLPRPVACASPDTPGDLGAFEVQADEYVAPTPVSAATPSPTLEPPTPAPTRALPTPMRTPVSEAVPVPSNDLLPVCGFLGAAILILAGFIALWLWRRSS